MYFCNSIQNQFADVDFANDFFIFLKINMKYNNLKDYDGKKKKLMEIWQKG